MSRPGSDDESLRELQAQREEVEAPCRPAQYRVLTRLAANPRNRLVVSFGGGSLHGLAGNAALAMLLEELELRQHVEEVWGTSAGAIVAAAWTSGTPAGEILEHLDRLQGERALDFDLKELFVKSPLRFLFKRRLPEGLVRGRRFREVIGGAVRVDRVEDCPLPLRILACTDDGKARKVIFRDGPVVERVFASMCLPGVFFPLEEWGEEGYFDGGVLEKTPLVAVIDEHVRSGDDRELVVLCTHFDSEARIKRPVGFLARFVSVIAAMEDIAWTHQLELAKQTRGCRTIVLNPRMEHGGMFEFEMVRDNALWARRRFKEQLSNAGLASRLEAR